MAQPKIDGDQIDGGSVTGVNADQLGGQIGSFYNDSTNLTGIIPSARLTGTYTITVSGNASTCTTASNSLLLEGSNKAFFRNASSIDAGTISDARLPNTISSDITGSAAKLGGAAASLYARLSNPIFTGNPRAPTAGASDNDTTIATTAFVKTAVSSSGFLTYGSFAYTGANQIVTVNHALGTVPKSILVKFVCAIADGGYSPGDVTFISAYGSHYSDSGGNNSGNVEGIFPYYNAASATTQMLFRIGNLGVHLCLKTSGQVFNPTIGRWNMIVYLAG